MKTMLKNTLAALAIVAMFAGPAMAASTDKGEDTNVICIPTGEDIFICIPWPILF
ncbi:MAG: hypothetical protein Tsb002_30970 [Wenzhouxiangellaceae bacterium]